MQKRWPLNCKIHCSAVPSGDLHSLEICVIGGQPRALGATWADPPNQKLTARRSKSGGVVDLNIGLTARRLVVGFMDAPLVRAAIIKG